MAISKNHFIFDEWENKYASRLADMRKSAVRDLFAAASRSDIISLSGGMPDISALPLDKVAAAAASSIRNEGVAALQYGGTDGRIQTREVAAMLCAESGVNTTAEELIITTGAQQALDLLAKTLIDPGDTIITEAPTYVGALQAFSAYQPNIIGIELDDNGMKMGALEEALNKAGKGNVKFIYTIPNFQNPGGVTMSISRRKKLLKLAREFETIVIEDDPYGKLRYVGEPLPTLRSLDDEVIYLGTVSKVFAPGLRLGWILAPRPIREKVILTKQGTDLCGSALNQVIVEHYFNDTPWKKTLATMNKRYAKRRDAMLGALEEFFPDEARFTRPEGGFFIWVSLPDFFDTDQMLSAALEDGVTYVPGVGCYPNGEGKSSMRLAFCYEEEAKLVEGVRRLSVVIEERMKLYRSFIRAGTLKV